MIFDDRYSSSFERCLPVFFSQNTPVFLVLCRNLMLSTISVSGLNWIEMISEYSSFWVLINLIDPIDSLVCSCFATFSDDYLFAINVDIPFNPFAPSFNFTWILYIRSWKRRNGRKKIIKRWIYTKKKSGPYGGPLSACSSHIIIILLHLRLINCVSLFFKIDMDNSDFNLMSLGG